MIALQEVQELTIQKIHHLLQTGELSVRELVQAYLARIEQFDQKGPAINAVIRVNPLALKAADELDAARRRGDACGLLHGIPVLVKDNIETVGLETTGGSLSLAGYIPRQDAFLISRLKQAGAVILAKTNLHEFAIWGETISSILGQTLNPYDLTRSPGGSSGGTGAAVAANFGAVGIGTDTVNSVRSPSSANCLVGVKSTLGLVSRTGIIPYSLNQDAAGPMTRCVADAAAILSVIAGYDPTDSATAACRAIEPANYLAHLNNEGLRGKRLGVIRNFFGKDSIHSEVNAVMATALQQLADQGATLVELSLPWTADWLISDVSLHQYDFREQLEAYLEGLGDQVSVHSIADILASGKYHPGISDALNRAGQLSQHGDEYSRRIILRQEVIRTTQKLLDDQRLDALVFPHQKRLVVPVGQPQLDRNGVLGAVTSFPAFTVPAGFSQPTAYAPQGVPVGLEFIGRPWSEPELFAITYAFEQATSVRKPPLVK